MKVCPNCNNMVEDSAAFCNTCGTRFAVQNNNPANYPQQPINQPNYAQQPQYNYATNQPPYQNAPQTPPKKKNTGMIIGIVAAVLVVFAIIGSVAQKAFQEQGYGDGGDDYTPPYSSGTTDSSSNEDTDTTTENSTSGITGSSTSAATDNGAAGVMTYSKGSMKDGWYINEWANMKFDANSNWTNGSADEYSSYEGDPNTECGIILNDAKNGKQLVICFEKLNGPSASITEEEYLDILTGGLKQQYENASLTCTVADYCNTTIAGETFKTARITFAEASTIQQFHVRKYDGYIIAIAAMAQDSFDVSSTVNNIRAIK